MGWWNIPDQKDAVIGDAVLDSARHFLKEFMTFSLANQYFVQIMQKNG